MACWVDTRDQLSSASSYLGGRYRQTDLVMFAVARGWWWVEKRFFGVMFSRDFV